MSHVSSGWVRYLQIAPAFDDDISHSVSARGAKRGQTGFAMVWICLHMFWLSDVFEFANVVCICVHWNSWKWGMTMEFNGWSRFTKWLGLVFMLIAFWDGYFQTWPFWKGFGVICGINTQSKPPFPSGFLLEQHFIKTSYEGQGMARVSLTSFLATLSISPPAFWP